MVPGATVPCNVCVCCGGHPGAVSDSGFGVSHMSAEVPTYKAHARGVKADLMDCLWVRQGTLNKKPQRQVAFDHE